MHVQSFPVKRHVAEACLQHVGPVNRQGKEGEREQHAVRVSQDACQVEAEAEGQQAEYGMPEQVERRAAVGFGGCFRSAFPAGRPVEVLEGDVPLYEVADDRGRVVACVQGEYLLRTVFEPQDQ